MVERLPGGLKRETFTEYLFSGWGVDRGCQSERPT